MVKDWVHHFTGHPAQRRSLKVAGAQRLTYLSPNKKTFASMLDFVSRLSYQLILPVRKDGLNSLQL